VDYIVKPFNRMEALARVQTHLRLHQALVEIEQLRQLALDANPLTQLPGNNTIKKTIEEKLKQQAAVTVVYCDLDNFKGFNDYYGFAAGDQALKFTAACLRYCLCEMAPDQHFLGNIGGDDFVFIAPTEKIQAVADRIAVAFDEGILDFYSAEDRQRGFILVKNRQDVMTQYPIMTISMAGVNLATAPYDHFLQVTYACSEMKHVSKKIAGSKLVLDRRRRPAA
jgi:diguanylate cyclase (GGDEF)-like protein